MFLVLFFINIQLFACGTIESWHSYYFDHKDDHKEQLYALTYLHCEPILSQQYKRTEEQHQLLLEILNDVFMNGNDCMKLMAIKNFFLFDELKNSKSFDREMVELWIEAQSSRKYVSSFYHKIKFKPYDYTDIEEYCKKTEQEIERGYYEQKKNKKNTEYTQIRLYKLRGVVKYKDFQPIYREDLNGYFTKDTLLAESEIDNLVAVLNCANEYEPPTCMYSPRHAIVFFKDDKIVSYIELCFHCKEGLIYGEKTLVFDAIKLTPSTYQVDDRHYLWGQKMEWLFNRFNLYR
jgi:hypothetical protein